ncbi:hypothetical protein M406DRAFT_350416 [Cryphonectria parasitica EP155]|uniref:Uncharacterized protein n=1 Tax=Cryphonectria parasitica (strain ATCC 38755 / EP155) TaxID=660469 RepID=A0A9P4Y685_CRYP1|nr:uncharacterized protein M406DRAFT_350416 [Cryphonectria parasitica EP155]KAF3767127.1 hypothetical protein M406DRAFT_350416 [Cryphonectria parasitica EP155]
MLTTASQFTPRTRCLQTSHAANARIVGVAGSWHRQQSRGFRFSMWSKYVDDDLQREIRRRQRILIHKYTEQVNRRLSWDKHPFAEDARHALKRMINTYWHPHCARPGPRSWNDAERHKQQTPENKDGVRPGQNIEDVERGAMDHLLFGQEKEEPFRGSHSRGSPPKTRSTAQTDDGRPIEQGDFVIDPITNRKVARDPSPRSTKPEGNIPLDVLERSQSPPTRHVNSLYNEISVEKTREDRSSDIGPGTEGSDISMDASDRPDPTVQNRGPLYDTNTLKTRSKLWSDAIPQATYSSNLLQKDKPVIVDQAEADKPEGFSKENLTDDDLQKSNPLQYLDPYGRPESVAEELHTQQQHDGLARPKTAADKAHEQFEDLNPPSEDLNKYESKPWLAEELSKRIVGDIEPSRPDQHTPVPSEVGASRSDAKTPFNVLNLHSADWTSELNGKPSSSTESSAKPEVHTRYRSFIEQLEPDDFTEPTVEDFRRKYGQTELKQYTPPKDLESDGNPDVDTAGGKGNDVSERMASTEMDSTDESGHEITCKTIQSKKGPGIDVMESLMEQHGRMSDAEDREATLAVKSARAKNQHGSASATKVTGSFVRDFPEEFEKSWTQTLSSVPTERTESDLSNAQVHSENMDGGLEGAFGRPSPSKIQPALDRQVHRNPVINHHDLQSKGSQGLEIPVVECSSDATPSLPEKYGNSPAASQDLPEEAASSMVKEPAAPSQDISSGSTDGPSLYKILAYDPTMQKVNMAETTSLVPDFTSALSPADALLRLSNPTKFLPHFAALEAQGFEIVSGSGDVLIFRKVRPSTTKQTEDSLAENKTGLSSVEAQPQPTSTPINPIDMTGRPRVVSPASANFASPTGYVNYENLAGNEASKLPPPPPPSSPRIKYNINLRREEPVYSGPKHAATDGQKKKSSLGKRLLVGGVWVAGISYGLGVVSEYFTTGGIDGTGPHGF